MARRPKGTGRFRDGWRRLVRAVRPMPATTHAPTPAAPQFPTVLLIVAGAISGTAAADGGSESFRDLDLNSYALGVNVLVTSSPYAGVEDTVIFYPAPTTYGSSIDSDEKFFVRDGDFGLRTRLANGWDLAGVLSIQTLGFGSSRSLALAGMRRRNWTVQGGVAVGRELGGLGGIRADVIAQTDLLGEHGGQEYELKLARTFDLGNHYLLPQIDFTYQSSDLVQHYFGVSAPEALPDRPEYRPGAATTFGASLEWGWRWHPRWFLTAEVGVDFLPSAIRSSPIVDEDYTYSVSVGFAYDAPTLIEARPPRPANVSALELTIGTFIAAADSVVFLTDGMGTIPIVLESDVNLRDVNVVVSFGAAWRISEFHRLKFGYFELNRDGTEDLVVPIDIGNVSFPAGAIVDTSFDTRVLNLGYAFSLLHDTQKELSVVGGLHVTDTSFRSASANDSVAADTVAILPMLGADLRINVTERLAVGAELSLFLSEFDRYSGTLLDLGIFGEYLWRERIVIGAGYRFFRQDIDTADESFFGDLSFDYRGPQVFIRARL